MDHYRQPPGIENQLGNLFQALPVEVKCEIFKRLTVNERPVARTVSRDWANVFDNHFELKLEAIDARTFRQHVKKYPNVQKLWILFSDFNYGRKLFSRRWENADFCKRITTAEFQLSLDVKNFGQLLKQMKNLVILTVNASSLKVNAETLEIPTVKTHKKLRKLRELNLYIPGNGIRYIDNVPTKGLTLIQTISPFIAKNSLRKFRLILTDSTVSGQRGESLEDLIRHGLIGPFLLGTEVKKEYRQLHQIFEDNYKTLVEVELKHSPQQGFITCRKCDQLHSFDFGSLFKFTPPKRRIFLDNFSKLTISTFIAGFQSSAMSCETDLDFLKTQKNLRHFAIKSFTRDNKATLSKVLKQNYATLSRVGIFYPTNADRDIEFGSNYWNCSIFSTCINLQWLFLEHYCGTYDREVVGENKMVHLTNLSKLPSSLKVLKTSFLITLAEATLEQTTDEWTSLVNLERLQLRRRPGWFQLLNGAETIYQIDSAHLQFFIKMLPALKSLELLSKAPRINFFPRNLQEEIHNSIPISDATLTWINSFEPNDIKITSTERNGNRHPIENVIEIGKSFRENLLQLDQEVEPIIPGGAEE